MFCTHTLKTQPSVKLLTAAICRFLVFFDVIKTLHLKCVGRAPIFNDERNASIRDTQQIIDGLFGNDYHTDRFLKIGLTTPHYTVAIKQHSLIR